MIKSPRFKINMNINKINKLKSNNILISNNFPNKYKTRIKISKTLKDLKERNIKRNAISGKKDNIIII